MQVHPPPTLSSISSQLQLREALLGHTLYSRITSLQRLRLFMESHVFCVWDFMSLLKRLQQEIAPTTLPWTPPQDPVAARFVNEIVLAEESDLDPGGRPVSHLELYLQAMDEVGANTDIFREFLARLSDGEGAQAALRNVGSSEHVRDFVGSTLDTALNGECVEVAAAFLGGREDPIPFMFQRIRDAWSGNLSAIPCFTHYLERHIELDAEAHAPAGRRLLARLIGGNADRQSKADQAAQRALSARLRLWTSLEAKLVEGNGARSHCPADPGTDRRGRDRQDRRS